MAYRLILGAMLISLFLFGLNFAVSIKDLAWENHEAISDDMVRKEELKKIALTFDDGPHPIYTELILAELKKEGAKATFFVMGKEAEKYPELVIRTVQEGHEVGNHTYSHLQLNVQNHENYIKELEQTSELLCRLLGENPTFLRPPYGTWDKKMEKQINMIPVLWTIDSKDWCSSDSQEVVRHVCECADEGSIILMHDGYESTIEAVPIILQELRKRGFEFVTVEGLLLE